MIQEVTFCGKLEGNGSSYVRCQSFFLRWRCVFLITNSLLLRGHYQQPICLEKAARGLARCRMVQE